MELETERLILRAFRESDWPDVLAYQVDARYLRYDAWTRRTAKEVREFVGMFLAQQQERPRTKFQLAITLKADRQRIGSCGIRVSSANARKGDIGYELSPAHWGCGFGSVAARAIVRFGFIHLKLHRVSSWCIADNVGSARVLEKLGMRLEGRLRDKEYFKGRWWDTLLYAILENQWREQTPPG
jgi:RimJ/RimL family protein N-acetyltransferase